MSLRVKQIAIGLVGVALFVGIYFGTKVSPTNKSKTEAQAPEDPAPAGSINWDEMEKAARGSLNIKDSAELALLKVKSDSITDLKNKSNALNDIVRFWVKQNKHSLAAHNLEKIAAIENTDTLWSQASMAYQAAISQVKAEVAPLFHQKVIACLRRAVALSPTNTQRKIQLANAIIDEGSAPMEGIGVLLDLVKQDSTNVEAHTELARLAIMSGQYDKALSRLELVKKLNPNYADALFLMGEAYKGTGNKEAAIAAFTECMKRVKGDSLKTALSMYIKELENN